MVSVKPAVEYFRMIRDIPYKIPTKMGEPDYCCSGKHKLLYRLFDSLKLKARFRVCEFSWSDMNLPKRVERVAHEDLSTHTYLETYSPKGKKWVVVDATWDAGLSKVFTVNDWDGYHDTKTAVKPTKIYSLKKSKNIVGDESVNDILNDLKINAKFYEAVNRWLKRIRTKDS